MLLLLLLLPLVVCQCAHFRRVTVTATASFCAALRVGRSYRVRGPRRCRIPASVRRPAAMSIANRDASVQCLAQSREAFRRNDLAKALALCEKSVRLYPIEEAKTVCWALNSATLFADANLMS